jgi:hypothetical protein
MSGIGFEVVIILLLVLASIFSMAEISVVAARKVRLQQRARRRSPRESGARAGAGPAQFPLHGAGRDHPHRYHGGRMAAPRYRCLSRA